jgi:hypothetical protein
MGGELAGWWDADDASTITFTASPQQVARWNDKSGNGHDLLDVGASGPLFVAGGMNGLDILHFDAVAKGLAREWTTDSPAISPASMTTSDIGVFIVYSKQFDEGGTFNTLFQITNSGSWNSGVHIGALESSAASLKVAVNVYTDNQVVITDSPSGTGQVSPETAAGKGNMVGLTWDESEDRITGYLNGDQKGTNTAETTAVDHTQTLFVGGGDAIGSWGWNGYIAEIVVINTAPTNIKRQRIEGYLAHKWGLDDLLDAGHPYKATPP